LDPLIIMIIAARQETMDQICLNVSLKRGLKKTPAPQTPQTIHQKWRTNESNKRFSYCSILFILYTYTVVPRPTLSLCSKKHRLARNSLGQGLFHVVNVLRYFKVV